MDGNLAPATFVYPPKLRAGDKVALLSPSGGLPALLPAIYEQGVQRLREMFQLQPLEYPTTRKWGATPQERADDLHAAFADPEIKAVFASIGGDDQIKLLKYLDADLLRAHPKAFFGYSDNTNLHNFLWNLGLVSYHGGMIMTEFGRGSAMSPYTQAGLQRALFDGGEYEIHPSPVYADQDHPWDDPANLGRDSELFPNSGWHWQGRADMVEGTLWGGNLEIISWSLRANQHILPVESYASKIFYCETSEELPAATEVYRILRDMGERGMLQQFAAVLPIDLRIVAQAATRLFNI